MSRSLLFKFLLSGFLILSFIRLANLDSSNLWGQVPATPQRDSDATDDNGKNANSQKTGQLEIQQLKEKIELAEIKLSIRDQQLVVGKEEKELLTEMVKASELMVPVAGAKYQAAAMELEQLRALRMTQAADPSTASRQKIAQTNLAGAEAERKMLKAQIATKTKKLTAHNATMKLFELRKNAATLRLNQLRARLRNAQKPGDVD